MSTDTPQTFHDLELDDRLLQALDEMGFEAPTPIQSEAIPLLLSGRDVLGGARTGSGKTAAFGLPLLHRLRHGGRVPKALVLAPTRELAKQVAEALDAMGRHLPVRLLTIYGGVGYRQQLRGLSAGVDVVVGTPGRVIDHIERGTLSLDELEVLVLDEADEMLQMGFIDDIERVLSVAPEGRQIALFSATMPKAIARIATEYQNDPARVQVESGRQKASHINQRWLKIAHRRKIEALDRILRSERRDATLVFARTKAGVAELGEALSRNGFNADALHGDLSQNARERVMAKLRNRRVDVLVATDVAARGLDVNHITHVVNYDLPDNSETYVHRIGRTGRAGREGWAISLVTAREVGKIKRMQRDLRNPIEQMSLPSDAQIANAQRKRLVDELDTAMDAKGSDLAEAWLAEVLGETGWSAEDVAAAALALLALERDFDIRRATPVPEVRQPKRRLDGEDTGFEHLNEVELFFPIGRRDGLRPADFVGALCNDAGLSSDTIGRISLGGHRAFVGLPRDVATALLASRETIEIRGRELPLSLSFSSESGDSNEKSGGKGYKKGGKRPHKKAHRPRPDSGDSEESSESPNPHFKRGRRSKFKAKVNGRGKNKRPKGKKTGDKNKGKRKPKPK